MQVFLPFESFAESAHCLDLKRLCNQRNECLVILRTILGESDAWSQHPAVRMWKPYGYVLAEYGLKVCAELYVRGLTSEHSNSVPFFQIQSEIVNKKIGHVIRPVWLGNEEFHRSHRSNLLRKDYAWYSRFFNEPTDLPYVWFDEQGARYLTKKELKAKQKLATSSLFLG